jgi:copper chaperone CopZ
MASRKSFRIPNMCCKNCAALVQHALAGLPGIQSVKIAVARKTVAVSWDEPTTWPDIERALDVNGYPPGPSFAEENKFARSYNRHDQEKV